MITRRSHLYILTIVMAILQAGCDTPPPVVIVGQSPGKMLQYPDSGIGKRICLLPVTLEYDLAGRYKAPTPSEAAQENFCKELETLSRKHLEQGGFEVVQLKDLSAESRPAAEKEWVEIRSHLKDVMNQYRSKDSVRESLSRIGQLAEVQTVILVDTKIRLGAIHKVEHTLETDILTLFQGASVDTSTTSIKAVVLSCHNGYQHWSNEIFMRQCPNMDILGQAFNLLFCTKSNQAK